MNAAIRLGKHDFSVFYFTLAIMQNMRVYVCKHVCALVCVCDSRKHQQIDIPILLHFCCTFIL